MWRERGKTLRATDTEQLTEAITVRGYMLTHTIHHTERKGKERKGGEKEELEEDERAREDEKAALRAMALRRKEHR